MEAELREQPGVLARNCSAYYSASEAYLARRAFDMVLLAARGSSDNAALYARYLLEIHVGIPVCLAAPSVLTRYRRQVRYPRCLAIGISQSGAAPDVAEVIRSMRDDGHATLAITNTVGSRLTEAAEATLLLDAGAETAVAATKSYSASLLALVQVARALGGDLPDPANHLPTESDLTNAEGFASDSVVRLVAESSPVFVLARGYSYASAQETALKLMECALIAAKSYSSADFQHGPKALVSNQSLGIVFGRDTSVWPGSRRLNIQVARPEPLAPITEILYGQWLALAAARFRGLDPDAPANLTKVTKTL